MDNGGVREKERHIVDESHDFGSEFHVKVIVRLGRDAGTGQRLDHLLDQRHGGGFLSLIGNGVDVVTIVAALADDAVGAVGAGGQASILEADIHGYVSCASGHDDAGQ